MMVIRPHLGEVEVDGRTIEVTPWQLRFVLGLVEGGGGFCRPDGFNGNDAKVVAYRLKRRGVPVISRYGYGYRLRWPATVEGATSKQAITADI